MWKSLLMNLLTSIGKMYTFLVMIQMLCGGIWKELFLEVLNKHAPLQHKKTKSSKVPWITNKVKCLITIRNKLKRKAIITKSETD